MSFVWSTQLVINISIHTFILCGEDTCSLSFTPTHTHTPTQLPEALVITRSVNKRDTVLLRAHDDHTAFPSQASTAC